MACWQQEALTAGVCSGQVAGGSGSGSTGGKMGEDVILDTTVVVAACARVEVSHAQS